MSYLDTPRFSFYGTFFANPSTINNATESYSLDAHYNNLPPSGANPTSVFWNPQGQAFFEIPGPPTTVPPASCNVTGAVGELDNPLPNDPVIGATVANIPWGGPPAQYGRLVDLDPDMQMRSMIVGMRLQISIGGTVALAGTVAPMTIEDIWGRMTAGATSGLGFPGCMYQSVLINLTWGNTGGSSVLGILQTMSDQSGTLSFKMNVDNYNGLPASPTFNFGRVAGTIGPYFPNSITGPWEPQHFVAQRKMSIFSTLVNANAVSIYNAPFQVKGPTLTVDLGNSISMNTSATGQVYPAPLGQVSAVIDPAGVNLSIPIYNNASEYQQQYVTAAGIYSLSLTPEQRTALGTAPLAIQVTPGAPGPAAFLGAPLTKLKEGISPALVGSPGTIGPSAQIGIAEYSDGFYASVDYAALRLENQQPSWNATPGATSGTMITGNALVPLVCTQWGTGASGQPINVTNVPNFYQFASATGGNPPINNTPMSAITVPSSVTTDADGRATLTVTANALSPAQQEPRRDALDSQLFFFTHDYTTDYTTQNVNLGPVLNPQPMSFLVFQDSPVVTSPTWWTDIQPIFLQYARLYPYMKGLIDLSDYATVVKYQTKILAMLTMAMDQPAFMPVTRDLSLLRRQMVVNWYGAGAPEGTPPAAPGAPEGTRPTTAGEQESQS
jgi:hypothetical protein